MFFCMCMAKQGHCEYPLMCSSKLIPAVSLFLRNATDIAKALQLNKVRFFWGANMWQPTASDAELKRLFLNELTREICSLKWFQTRFVYCDLFQLNSIYLFSRNLRFIFSIEYILITRNHGVFSSVIPWVPAKAWKMILSFWGSAYFQQGRSVCFSQVV